jgi:hypothetical protein
MIVLITPTGGRPKQFALCNRWMSQQTYTGKVLWIVVDDCLPMTTEINIPLPENWTVVHKYPRPVWRVGVNTQTRNIQAGIDVVKALPQKQISGIFIIEDDDYYKPIYLEKMMRMLDGFDVAAEKFTIYYHVGIKSFHGSENRIHASLFQVCFKPMAIPVFENSMNCKFIDKRFFINAKGKGGLKVNLFKRKDYAIGIKGLNGRAGIGMGHNESTYRIKDTDLTNLKNFIGSDYTYYV